MRRTNQIMKLKISFQVSFPEQVKINKKKKKLFIIQIYRNHISPMKTIHIIYLKMLFSPKLQKLIQTQKTRQR
jgi:hypothetical protein